jgi:osmoprotectant transport system permease protein
VTDPRSYVVGAKSFTEQYILSALMADRIAASGGSASRRVGLGSAIAFNALAAGEIDVYVDYSGTIWANQMHRVDVLPRDALVRAVKDWLAREHGIELLGALGFENAYALAMRRDRAAELGVRTIGDLAAHSRELAIGADFEFFARPEWPALRKSYGLDFARRREFQSTFMYEAVAAGDVDVITAFTSDGRISAYDLVILDDPRGAILPYDAVVLVSKRRANDPLLHAALEPLIGAIPVELMRSANDRVDRAEAKESAVAAAQWLGGELAEH